MLIDRVFLFSIFSLFYLFFFFLASATIMFRTRVERASSVIILRRDPWDNCNFQPTRRVTLHGIVSFIVSVRRHLADRHDPRDLIVCYYEGLFSSLAD